RRPKVVRFYRNGDRYFRARTLHITPHRYVSWPELLADLSRAVPLPYGVRRLYTPLGGSPVAGSVDALRDGEAYVCASFEPFRSVKDFSRNKQPQLSYNATCGASTICLDKGVRQNFLRRPENYVPARPKVITVVRVGGRGPRRRITLLLNRRAAQSFEELLGDISEALGLPRWRTNHVRRLYTLRGREARSVSDFFRGDDVFLAATRKDERAGRSQSVRREFGEAAKQVQAEGEGGGAAVGTGSVAEGAARAGAEATGEGEGCRGGGQDRDRRTVRSDSDVNPKKDKDFGTKGDNSEIPVRNYWNGESDKEIPRQYRNNNGNVVPHKGKAKNKLKDGDADKKSKKFPNLPMPIVSLQDIESRYEIGRTIGDGNFATVKECRRVSSGDGSAGEAEWDLAMKIIDKAKLVGREEMLRSEVALTTRLGQHPNVVRLVEAMESPSDAYLVLERVRGGDLFDAITESVRFTERHAAAMVADLCRALQYLHANNIVHRDVKPENLLVQRNADGGTTLKLADLGLAMEVTGPIYTVCGTPTYVAPEILAETGYGLEVDMWAAGVITYILLCGFPPFRSLERDQEELFEIIQLGEYEFLSPYWDHISDGHEAAKDLVSRLLVVDTARRYTARQALHHPWVSDGGAGDHTDLHREVTMNIQRHF
uniref:non-specific serine/threonine protein kinase n=1 Tax=Petromyzon marinus TaxID=7757 RepID=S4RZ61_PETMA